MGPTPLLLLTQHWPSSPEANILLNLCYVRTMTTSSSDNEIEDREIPDGVAMDNAAETEGYGDRMRSSGTIRVATMNCNAVYDRCLLENQRRFRSTQFSFVDDTTFLPSQEMRVRITARTIHIPDQQHGSQAPNSAVSQGSVMSPATWIASQASGGQMNQSTGQDKRPAEDRKQHYSHKRPKQG